MKLSPCQLVGPTGGDRRSSLSAAHRAGRAQDDDRTTPGSARVACILSSAVGYFCTHVRIWAMRVRWGGPRDIRTNGGKQERERGREGERERERDKRKDIKDKVTDNKINR
ncbi:hypothetical protein EYF80_054035 [Liparis tanakae]|uniref:Uncharacterized protein n=1 Tax=Liparis tanakae TaxID=230148 RepID=A0A4Z2F4H5_9TELE|nr:hypothetical protein EYF80_054035 [Liparis tanakae]